MPRLPLPTDLIVTTLRLTPGTYTRLDKLRDRMRERHHRQPPRSELLRGIIAGVLAAKDLDLSDSLTAKAIEKKVSEALKGGRA